MFCSNCGEKIDDGAKFCMKCGTAIGGMPNAPVIPLSQQQSAVVLENNSTEVKNSNPEQSATSINQDEPENILLKAGVTAEQEYPSHAINNGTLIITNKRVVFKSSRLLNVDLFGLADSDLSIYYNEIADFRSTKYSFVFPAIEITTKYGYKIKFAGYGKIKTVYKIICEKMKLYA